MSQNLPFIFPRLAADELGVWREDKPDQRFGIIWDEIAAVNRYKLDAITATSTVVEIEHPSGHFIELSAEWPGFQQVAQEISSRLTGIRPSWLDDIMALELRAPPICVWRKS